MPFARVLAAVGVGAFALAALLFLPAPASPPDAARPARVCLVVDASASVRRPRPGWPSWVRGGLREEALAAAERGDEVALIAFAAGASLVAPPEPAEALLDRIEGRRMAPLDPRRGAGADDASRLADALRIASGVLAEDATDGDTVVLFSDAEFTDEDPSAELASLLAGGVAVRVRTPPLAARSDLSLEALELPPSVEPGAPLVAVAHLAFTAGTRAVRAAPLALDVENGGIAERIRAELTLPAVAPGATERWRVGVPLGPAAAGRTLVDGRVALADGPDPFPENDVQRASTVASGVLSIGVVAAPEQLAHARAWLAPSGACTLAGIELAFVEPAQLPGVLDELDALVSFDLPPSGLPRIPLEAFVEGGGGWLCVSGWRFLSDWFPGQEPRGLAGLLPLAPEPLDQRDRDVVLLVDGSGSMAGEPFDAVRAATLELVGAALPGDRIGLRFFTTGIEGETLVRDRASAEDDGAAVATRLLNARVPGGQTMILRSLEQFVDRREGRTTECLALLLTDGRERETLFDPAGRCARLLGRLDAARTRLRVVAVGEDPDLELLGRLTRPGETVARAEGLADLESIFRRAVGGARVREGDALAVRAARAGPDALATAALGDTAPPPPVRVFVRNRLRPGAEAAWVGPGGEPLLALQRVGAGRTALLSTSPVPEWALGWAGRAGVGEPSELGPLLRWLGRSAAERRRSPLALRLEDRELLLSGLAPAWPAYFDAELWPAAGGEGDAPLARVLFGPRFRPSGAAAPDRRVAPWPADLVSPASFAPYGLVARLVGREAGPGPAVAVRTGLPPELRGAAARLDTAWLARPPGPRAAAPGTASAGHPAAPWVLGTGLVAWFLAAASGRRGRTTVKGSSSAVDRAAGAAEDPRPRMEST